MLSPRHRDVGPNTSGCWPQHIGMLGSTHRDVGPNTSGCWPQHIGMLATTHRDVGHNTSGCWAQHIGLLGQHIGMLATTHRDVGHNTSGCWPQHIGMLGSTHRVVGPNTSGPDVLSQHPDVLSPTSRCVWIRPTGSAVFRLSVVSHPWVCLGQICSGWPRAFRAPFGLRLRPYRQFAPVLDPNGHGMASWLHLLPWGMVANHSLISGEFWQTSLFGMCVYVIYGSSMI